MGDASISDEARKPGLGWYIVENTGCPTGCPSGGDRPIRSGPLIFVSESGYRATRVVARKCGCQWNFDAGVGPQAGVATRHPARVVWARRERRGGGNVKPHSFFFCF